MATTPPLVWDFFAFAAIVVVVVEPVEDVVVPKSLSIEESVNSESSIDVEDVVVPFVSFLVVVVVAGFTVVVVILSVVVVAGGAVVVVATTTVVVVAT